MAHIGIDRPFNNNFFTHAFTQMLLLTAVAHRNIKKRKYSHVKKKCIQDPEQKFRKLRGKSGSSGKNPGSPGRTPGKIR